MIDDFLDGLFGGRRAHGGTRPGAQPFGDAHTHLDTRFRVALLKRLRVGVGHDELDAFELLLDHIIDGVTARTTDAENRNPRLQLLAVTHHQIQSHRYPPVYTLCP